MAVDHSADGSTISISSQDKRGQPQELYLEKSRTEMERQGANPCGEEGNNDGQNQEEENQDYDLKKYQTN